MTYETSCCDRFLEASVTQGIAAYKAIKPLINRAKRDKTMALTCAAVAALAFPFFGISGILTSLSAFSGYSLAKDGSYFYHPSFQKRELTEEEKTKLRSLKKDPSIRGVSWAYNETKSSWEPIYIKKSERTIYSAFNLQDQELGHASAFNQSDPSSPFKSGYAINSGSCCLLSALYTETYQQKIDQKYKYIGYLLVKSIEEETRSVSQGRISITANKKAVDFYEKLGFETRFIGEKRLPRMILPESTAKKWSTYSPFSVPSENL